VVDDAVLLPAAHVKYRPTPSLKSGRNLRPATGVRAWSAFAAFACFWVCPTCFIR